MDRKGIENSVGVGAFVLVKVYFGLILTINDDLYFI
jgi:hypothetical protein